MQARSQVPHGRSRDPSTISTADIGIAAWNYYYERRLEPARK